MKKIINLTLLFLLIGMFATACKKETTPTPTVQTGLWWGNNSINPNTNLSNSFAILLKNDGTLIEYENSSIVADTATAVKALGTYTLTGNTLKSTYIFSPPHSIDTINATGTLSANQSAVNGTWATSTNTHSGNFRLNFGM